MQVLPTESKFELFPGNKYAFKICYRVINWQLLKYKNLARKDTCSVLNLIIYRDANCKWTQTQLEIIKNLIKIVLYNLKKKFY